MITVVGHSAYDYIFQVENYPSINHSSYINEWKKCYGGGGANISVGIASLGGKSRLYTAGGMDFKRYESYLRKKGIELILHKSNNKTARAYIFNKNGEQIMFFYWGASKEMEKMKGIPTDYLHIAPCHPKLAIEMAEKAKFFAFEPGQDLKKFKKDELSHIVEKADIIFCNEIELNQMEKLVKLKGKEVIVTMGGKGSVIYRSGKKIPSLPAKVIDATGAGDAYKAGFWIAFMKGYEMEECCKIGSVVSSFVVEKIGAQTFPMWDEVEERYKKYFGSKA